MIAEIIPARRMPLALPILDYLVSEKDCHNIQIGQLVKISLHGHEEFGVVFDIKNSQQIITRQVGKKPPKLIPITEIVFHTPIISKAQLDFLRNMSDFYHVSLGFLLKNNLPPLQKNKLKKVIPPSISLEPVRNLRDKPNLTIYKNQTEREKTIVGLLSTATGQTLLLTPEVISLDKIKKILPAEVLEKSVFVTSNLSQKELYFIWMQIWRSEKSIIIGTRRAIFLPWFNLQQIIVDDESNINYKSWDMAPRFHTRDASLILSKSHGSKLSLLSHSPSVETYFFAQKKVYNSPDLDIAPFAKPVQLVDMRAQRRAKNFSLLSTDLFEAFTQTKSGDIFFFLNRRGTVGYVACSDCGEILKCPTCHLSLTYYQKNLQLVCHYCKYTQPMPLYCQKCHGAEVRMFGVGTQMVEDLIKKIITQKKDYSVVRIDSDEKDLNKLETSASGNRIIIGTQLAWSRVDWSKIKLFAILDADTSLFIPEYKVIEHIWLQLRDAQFNLPSDAQIFIQTNHRDSIVFSDLFNPQSFYSGQLAERKLLGYPPFKFLLKLAKGSQSLQLAQTEARQTALKLINLTKNNSDITILGPLDASPAYYHGQYWQIILAKIKYENYKKNSNLITSQLSDSWKVDPNPNSILSFS